MVVNYESEFRRLMHFLEKQKFPHIDRVKHDGSLRDLSVTNFLCVMEFMMNLVCNEQLNWKPVPILCGGGLRMQISREDRNKILHHIMNWQQDLSIHPKLIKSQITNELTSWSMRRGDLLIAAMDELDKMFNDTTVPSEKRTQRVLRFSMSLMESFTQGSFDDSQEQEDSSMNSASTSSGALSFLQ